MARTLSGISRYLDVALEASVIGSFTRVGPAARRRLGHWKPPSPTPGRVVVITGASSGLGKQAAHDLADLGCTMVLVGRDNARLEEVATALRSKGSSVIVECADLSDLSQSADLCDRLSGQLDRIDVLINNAGALLQTYQLGPQSREVTLSVHLLSPYILTSRLAPLMASDQPKVITMTSGGMYTEPFVLKRLEITPEKYRGSVAYARAKRAQVVLNQALARREPMGQRTFCAVHPGWAKTPGVSESLPTFDKLLGPLLRTPQEGVETLVWLSTLPEGEPESGLLWLDRQPRSPYHLPKTKVSDETQVAEGNELISWLDEVTAPFL